MGQNMSLCHVALLSDLPGMVINSRKRKSVSELRTVSASGMVLNAELSLSVHEHVGVKGAERVLI